MLSKFLSSNDKDESVNSMKTEFYVTRKTVLFSTDRETSPEDVHLPARLILGMPKVGLNRQFVQVLIVLNKLTCVIANFICQLHLRSKSPNIKSIIFQNYSKTAVIECQDIIHHYLRWYGNRLSSMCHV